MLDKFIDLAMEQYGLSEIDILQYIFWSAHELKIHFRMDGKNMLPFEVKHILLLSPEKPVELITNKSVKKTIFKDVVSFYKKLSGEKNHVDFGDQYALACSLLSDLKNWKSTLDSFKPVAKKNFYPGKEKINNNLRLLKIMLGKQDTYSLIYTCYNNKEKITKIADDVKLLSGFYTRHIKFWKLLIQSIENFRVNLTEIKKNPDLFSKFNRLTQILASPAPYDLIPEADELLKRVQHHNNLIVEKAKKIHCQKAISKIEAMIEKLLNLFNCHNTDKVMRNNFLYALRTINKQLPYLKNIKQIDLLLCDAEDMFDDFIEELAEK